MLPATAPSEAVPEISRPRQRQLAFWIFLAETADCINGITDAAGFKFTIKYLIGWIVCDNGIKLVDSDGGMLAQSWEAYATAVANA